MIITAAQILVHPTYALSGSRAPISLSHVFNSSEQGADIGYGKGFRLNYHQTIDGEEDRKYRLLLPD